MHGGTGRTKRYLIRGAGLTAVTAIGAWLVAVVMPAAQTLASDGRVVRADSSPAGRFTVIWQQQSYPYAIRTRTGQ